jgi:hypothetical protein
VRSCVFARRINLSHGALQANNDEIEADDRIRGDAI